METSVGVMRIMPVVSMTRFQSNQYGTYSVVRMPEGELFLMGELPWKDNKQNVSCIPTGEYVCRRIVSPKFGEVYQLDNVPNRTHILIHVGNFVGDTNKNLKSDVEGCLVIGKRIGALSRANAGSQLAVLDSGLALRNFVDTLNAKNFVLRIQGVVG